MKQELIPAEVVETPNCLDWFCTCKVLQGHTTLLLLLQIPCVGWRNILLGLLSVFYIKDNSYLPGRNKKGLLLEREREREEKCPHRFIQIRTKGVIIVYPL